MHDNSRKQPEHHLLDERMRFNAVDKIGISTLLGIPVRYFTCARMPTVTVLSFQQCWDLSIATGNSAALGAIIQLAAQKHASGYSNRSFITGYGCQDRALLDTYIMSALAGSIAQEQRLSFYSI